MYNFYQSQPDPEVTMAPTTISGLLALLDGGDKQTALEAARAMREDHEGNESLRGIIVRIYTDIVIGLCAIWLTGPSQDIGDRFDRAGREATLAHNEPLALLASWYEACCRLMRRTERSDIQDAHTNDNAWNLLYIQFGMVGARANRLNDHMRSLFASALAYECQARMSERPPAFESGVEQLLRQTYAADEDASHKDPRITECIRLLQALAGHGALDEPVNYSLLLYAKGELLGTIR